jgi:hypothetical protein
MSHWSKDAVVERAIDDAVEMSTLDLGALLISKDENLNWENISEHVKDKDDLINKAIDILVEEYMNQSPY